LRWDWCGRQGRGEWDQLQRTLEAQPVICKKQIRMADLQAVICQKIQQGRLIGVILDVPNGASIRQACINGSFDPQCFTLLLVR